MFANSQPQHKGSPQPGLPFFCVCVVVTLCVSLLSVPVAGQTAAETEPAQATTASSEKEPIRSEWRESKEALLRDVLRYLQAENLRGLAAITLDSADYQAVVWPELPISNPRNNIPFEFVFGRHNQLSRGGLLMKLKEFKGKHYELVRFEESPERDKYKAIRIVPIGKIVLRDATGKELPVRLIGSILEHNGRFKVFSYKTD